MNEHEPVEVSDDLRQQMHRDHTKDSLITEVAHWQRHADELESYLAGARSDLDKRDRGDAEALAIARCAHALNALAGAVPVRSVSPDSYATVSRYDGPDPRSRVGRVLAYLAERYGQRPPDEHARRLEEELGRANRRVEELETQLRNVSASIMEDAL